MKKITKLFCLLTIIVLGMSNKVSGQCAAQFIWSNQANGVVSFTSTSAPVTSLTTYYWNFGNGSTYSATGNPGAAAFNTYTANGTYTVTLFIYSAAPSCSSAISHTIAVTNATNSSGCNLTAGFSNSLGGPGTMNFNNNSTGTISTTSYTWSYGDGTFSYGTNGTRTYLANGTYTVTLTAMNSATCVSTKTIQAVITTVCNLNASFNSTNGINGSVSFVSTSTGTSSGTYYTWNFGDGSSVSHQLSPTHVYSTGSYVAVLTIANSSVSPTCTSSVSHTITATNTCVANANFTLTYSGTPHLWLATPPSNTNIVAAQWSWGDGSTSNTLITSHQYSASGMYSICLSVTLSCGATAMACSAYSVYKSTSDMVNVNVIDPITVGLNEATLLGGKVTVFPNPNNGVFNVQLTGGTTGAVIEVMNLFGQTVYRSEEPNSSENFVKPVNLTTLENGIYFVKVSEGKQSTTTKISVSK